MSVTEKKTATYRCPACGDDMGQWDTICAKCRSDLEAAVFAVRATDYPAPARANVKKDKSPEHLEPDAESINAAHEKAMLAVIGDTDADLVPLVPLEEEAKRSAVNPPAASSAIDTSSPAEVTGPHPPVDLSLVHDSDSALEPHHRWKHLVLAVVALVLAGLIAAILWSYVVPGDELAEPAGSPRTPAVHSP